MKYEYQIALSFAGEQRNFVEAVAERLQEKGVSVFYDHFEEGNLWGKNLYEHLRTVYRDKAKYTVIFCSKEYAEKIWTNHERESAQERALNENSEYILPIRFDETEIPGLPSTISYLDANKKNPKHICEIILGKLKIADQSKTEFQTKPISSINPALKLIQRETKFLWLEIIEVNTLDLSCVAEIKKSTISKVRTSLDYLENNGYFQLTICFSYKCASTNEDIMEVRLDCIEPKLINLARNIEAKEPRKSVEQGASHNERKRSS